MSSAKVPSRPGWRNGGAGALAAALLLPGCGGEDGPVPAAPAGHEERPARGEAEPAPDDLAALGYVDFAEDDGGGASGVVLRDAARSWPGYDLYVSIPFASAALLDPDGVEVARWSDPEAHRWLRCELLAGGDVVVLGLAPGEGRRAFVERRAPDGALRWRTPIPAHHDLEPLADGTFLVLVHEARPADPSVGRPAVLDSVVARLSADGEVLERRSLGDVLAVDRGLGDRGLERTLEGLPDADRDAFALALAEAEAFERADGGEAPPAEPAERGPATRGLDLLHANAVVWVDDPGGGPCALVTLRHQDAVSLFRWETGEELWRFGRGLLQGPHEASLLPNGNVLVLDNGIRGRGHSRVLEVDPRRGEIAWSWTAPVPEEFYCRTRGTCQALPNGNVLVSDSERGEAFEVARSGEVVWRFVAPERDEEGRRGALRLRRYPAEHVRAVLDARR